MTHNYSTCQKHNCTDCILIHSVIDIYGPNYRNTPEWSESNTYAARRAYTSIESLEDCIENGTITEGQYLSQMNGYVYAFYRDETWQHIRMLQLHNENH